MHDREYIDSQHECKSILAIWAKYLSRNEMISTSTWSTDLGILLFIREF
jgi:hypothetical protein